jgi:hypothetical protein
MAPRSTGTRARSALMLIAAAALVGIGGAWLAWRQAEVLVDRALTIVLGSGEKAYRSIMLHPDGQIVVEDLVFRAADEPDSVRVERLLVETPGWRWFLRNALDPELRGARLDRLRLSMNGVRVDNEGPLPLTDLGVFGVNSASPWDADGCPVEVRWTRQTLAEAGLTPRSTSLQFDYRAQDGDLLSTVILETYGVSRLQWDRIGTLPSDEGNLLRLAAEPGLIRSERWEVQDQGFVTARNRYCAGKSRIDERRFVARHVETVARRLATLGLEADADTRDRYRRFALAGGKLSLSVSLPRPMSASTLLQLHRSAAWSDTVTTLDRSGDIGTLHWQRTQTGPSPNVASDVSIDTELPQGLADGFEGVASASGPPTMDPEIAAVPPPTAEMPVAAPDDVEAPNEVRIEATATAAAMPPPPEQPPAASSEPALRTAPAHPTAQIAIPPLTRFATPAPETAARAAIRSTARVAPTRPAASAPKPLRWNELRSLRGRTIEISTKHSPARQVQILEFGNDAMLVSYRIKNSGEATFSIRRESFVRAVLKS